jgi:serine/threonine-protein kinase
VPVYDVGEDDGLPYFVMRYMTGGSLTDWIEKGRFSIEDTARIVERISQALSYAHKKGIIHRDLKPDNILFDNNGDPFISDFGVAKFAEAAASLTGSGVVGTPAYMSPEQAQGLSLDNRSDVYGLGVIVYQMLSGRQPYNADTPMGVVVKHITDPVPEILRVNPDLPEAADTIIKNAMAKDRDKRYSTATDLSRALYVAAFGVEPATSPKPTMPRATEPVARSSGSRVGPIVGGAVLIVVLAGVFLLRNQLFVSAEPTATATLTARPATSTVPPLTATRPASTPTRTAVPTATVIPFAPQCAAENIPPVELPVVDETNKECIAKIPYTSLRIPKGATFESQSPNMTCTQQREAGDQVLIACTGTQLFSFDLKVCNPPVTAPASTDGKCQQGDIYNEAGICCYAPPPAEASCTIFQVDIRGCP